MLYYSYEITQKDYGKGNSMIPKYATLLLGRNCKCEVINVHFDTHQVTLKEREKVFNTVLIKDVVFDYTGYSKIEIIAFLKRFSQ